jgi:hypothetical protein
MRLLAACVLSAGILACGAPPTTEGALEIGTGVEAHAPLAPGGALAVHQGPQGGFHVYLTLRARGVAPGRPGELARPCAQRGENPCVSFEVRDADAEARIDGFAPLRLPLTAGAGAEGGYDLLPPRLVTIAAGSLASVDGRRLRVRAEVVDARGVHAGSEVVVTAVAVR